MARVTVKKKGAKKKAVKKKASKKKAKAKMSVCCAGAMIRLH